MNFDFKYDVFGVFLLQEEGKYFVQPLDLSGALTAPRIHH